MKQIIKSFADKETEKIFNRHFSRKLRNEIQLAARRKLEILNAAESLQDLRVPPRRINEIVQGKRSISPDTALRLALYFGLSEQFWINLQMRYDLEIEKDKLADRLEKEVRVLQAA